MKTIFFGLLCWAAHAPLKSVLVVFLWWAAATVWALRFADYVKQQLHDIEHGAHPAAMIDYGSDADVTLESQQPPPRSFREMADEVRRKSFGI
jgi:hypothetical protein